MACLQNCQYCGKSTVNAEYHDACRVAHLEDLLFKVQNHIKSTGDELLPPEIIRAILKDHYLPKEQRQARNAAQQNRELMTAEQMLHSAFRARRESQAIG
jgi:hypothetical protein